METNVSHGPVGRDAEVLECLNGRSRIRNKRARALMRGMIWLSGAGLVMVPLLLVVGILVSIHASGIADALDRVRLRRLCRGALFWTLMVLYAREGPASPSNTMLFPRALDMVALEKVSISTRPTSREDKPGWPEYHEILKARANEMGSSTKLVLIGDSITEELAGTSIGKDFVWNRSDEDQLSVWKEYYEPFGALNLGVGGDRTEHVLWRLQNGELPDTLQPQVVMLAIGTNDLGWGMGPAQAVRGIIDIVEFLVEARPDALICVMALFPRRVYKELEGEPKPWPATYEVNKGVSEELLIKWKGEVRFINCSDRFLAKNDAGETILNMDVMKEDRLHLNIAGLRAWAECASEDLQSGLH